MLLLRKIIVISLLLLVGVYALYDFVSHRPPALWDVSGTPQHELRVLQRAIYYIKNNYVGPDRIDARQMLKNGVEALQQAVAPVMTDWNDGYFVLSVANQKRRFEVTEDIQLSDLPIFFGHVLDFTETHLPEARPEDSDKLEYVMLDGVVSTLDPHSNFLRPKIYSEFRIGTSGNFGGIGIAIGIREAYLTVIAPLEGTPAHRAGLKAGDRIIQVGDERTINMSLTEAVERLRGKVGTKVTILVTREGEKEPLEFTIRRAMISIDSVKAELLDNRVALLKIKNFQEDTASELMRETRRLAAASNGLNGVILDLRNNPGGLLDQAVAVADAFLAKGIIVSTVGFNDQLNEEDHARKNHLLEMVPLVVLVNEGSASASEILAGALQVHDRALVIGNRTFGKGTVQTLYDMKDGSALKLTIAKYLAAGTEDVQNYGIIPDIGMIPVRINDERIDMVENEVRREHDLEKHLAGQEEPRPDREPAFKLHYIQEEEDPEQVTGTINLAHDYPVELATKILHFSDGIGRSAQLDYLKETIDEHIAGQDKLISMRLKEQDIDWARGNNDGSPEAIIEFWVTRTEKKVEEIVGGDEIKLNLRVENVGKDPFYRLLAVTESENPLFDNLEFPLGQIAPGKSRTYLVAVSLPATLASQHVPVKIVFHEQHDDVPKVQEIPIAIRFIDAPRFVYKWSVANGDRDIRPGDNVAITFSVKNIGSGTSEKPVINLVNKEGDRIFLKEGRAKLDPIQPGETKEATLRFRFKDDFDADSAKLDLLIEDQHTGYRLRDSLKLSLNGSPHDPPMEQIQYPPQLEIELPDQPYWSKNQHYRFRGTASDDGRIKEIYAFVNLDKVYYQSNRDSENGNLPFSLKVPLQDGVNRITVVAKDDRDLITREQWVVWKPE